MSSVLHECFLSSYHVARQAAEAEKKQQISYYDVEIKGWDWDQYIALQKEQHAIMERLADYGYSGMGNGTKVHHFLQDIKSTELEAAVNVIQAQPEKNGTDFDTTVSYLGQTVTKKGPFVQSVHIAKTRSQPVRPKVVVFMEKI